MGRSVEVRPGALLTVYPEWVENHVSLCQHCDDEVTKNFKSGYEWEDSHGDRYCHARFVELEGDYTEECDIERFTDEAVHEGWEFDSDDFTANVEWLQIDLTDGWPSFEDTDRWARYPYNETRIISQNALVEVSVSEYCGVVALSITPRDDVPMGLARGFVKQIEKKFTEYFGG